MGTLFHAGIKKELNRNFGATFVVLVTVVTTMMLIRALFLANKGRINPTEVLMVMGYFVLGHLPTLLTLCLFVSIVATLSRLYFESEMVIWFGTGKGLVAFFRPVFSFALPVCATTALLALFVWPWSNQQTQVMRQQFEQRNDFDRLTTGKFQESNGGNRVFFIDKNIEYMKNKTMENPSTLPKTIQINKLAHDNIFIYANTINKKTITTAESGKIAPMSQAPGTLRLQRKIGDWEKDKPSKQTATPSSSNHQTATYAPAYVFLFNGQRTETSTNSTLPTAAQQSTEITISEFGLYGHAVPVPPLFALLDEKNNSRTQKSWTLWQEHTTEQLGELSWRLGLAFAAFNCVLLGIGLAQGNHRVGKSKGVMLAVVGFIAYYNAINIGQNWITNGKYPFVAVLIVLHFGVAAFAAWLIFRKHNRY